MEKYDYRAAIRDAINSYIDECSEKLFVDIDVDNWRGEHIDDCRLQVTGNDNGSYFCDTWKAEEALCHNWDLLIEACNEYTNGALPQSVETADVLVRENLFDQCFNEVIIEREQQYEESLDSDESEGEEASFGRYR